MQPKQLWFRLFFIIGVTVTIWSCQSERPSSTPRPDRLDGRPWKLICLGDGITAGVGLPQDVTAYPARLASMLSRAEDSVQVVNASLKGETLVGALTRLPWMFQQRFDALLIALGDASLHAQTDVEEWTREWKELFTQLRAIDPEMSVFVLILSSQKPTAKYKEVVKNLALSYDAHWLDVSAEDFIAQPSFWQGSPAQLTPAGHDWLATWLAKKMENTWLEE